MNSEGNVRITPTTQFVIMQTIDDDGQPDGEYRLTSDILFTPSGKRYQKIPMPQFRLSIAFKCPTGFDDMKSVAAGDDPGRIAQV